METQPWNFVFRLLPLVLSIVQFRFLQVHPISAWVRKNHESWVNHLGRRARNEIKIMFDIVWADSRGSGH